MQTEPMNLTISEMELLIMHGEQHEGMLAINRKLLSTQDQQPKTKNVGME